MSNQTVRPNWHSGFARSAGESANPDMWKGLIGAWVPSLGITGNKLFDLSGRVNHGDLTDTAWNVTTKGLSINHTTEDAAANCGNDSLFDFTSENFTIITGVIPVSTQSDYGVFLCRGLANADGWYFQIDETASNDGIYFSWYEGSFQTVHTDPILNIGELNILAAVRNGSNLDIYNNGVEATYVAQPSIGTITTSSRNLYLGRYDAAAVDFDGSTLFTYIFNRALIPAEIAQLNANPYGMFQQAFNPALFFVAAGNPHYYYAQQQ